MTLPLEGHQIVSWPVLGSRPAYGDETDWFTTTEYGCLCGVKYGQQRGYGGDSHREMVSWFMQHCLTELGAKFEVQELTLEESVDRGVREAPSEHELIVRQYRRSGL